AEIVNLLAPIASALDFAHQRNVIHGALRPAAILLGKQGETSPGEPKLTDFGLNHMQNPLALPLDDVQYVSPEIAQGLASTQRSDLYSLGVILYEICTGTVPFHGDTSSDILMQHIHGTPPSPVLINPYIPPGLTAVIMRSLAREQAARYPSAIALVAAVAKAANVNMPESISRALPSVSSINPPSFSGISGPLDTMNSPTYLSQQSQQLPPKALPVPPVVASRDTPALPRNPVISPSTPVLPLMQTGERYAPTAQIAQPSQSVSATTPVLAPAPLKQRRRPTWLYIALAAAVLLVVVGGSALGLYLYNSRTVPPSSPPIVGHAFFMSSGLLGGISSNQGITDELEISLQNIPNPQPGKSYYAWLLNDTQTSLPAVPLGPLLVTHGQVTKLYVDQLHNNLLTNYSRFLITEEGTSPPPVTPSLDNTAWVYSAAFPTTPNPADTVNHFSVLDHLRHLLSQDPKLKTAGLGGGLDIWLFRNVTKVVEQAGSARDAQGQCTPAPNNASCGDIHRAVVRVLDYLDGSTYVNTEVPSNTPLLINQTIARVALLEFDPVHQQPPGYLDHIGTHLRELANAPGVTTGQHNLAIQIGQAINNVQGWLQAVRADAVKLVQMNNSQLSQPAALTLLNDLLTQAKYALVGFLDPNTNTVRDGVAQIHDDIQGLATFNVTPCTTTNGKNSCA
ncbi:MAG TPA: serine/threonine-protein kinase, partial [Ktedonobacteraceae bacterium]|nr:serine/threonine-protein kinase [Ktedonobacteraceae bacterium]